jgi:hypothetical protein
MQFVWIHSEFTVQEARNLTYRFHDFVVSAVVTIRQVELGMMDVLGTLRKLLNPR